MAEYEIRITDDTGRNPVILDTLHNLSASRIANAIGEIEIEIPHTTNLDLVDPSRDSIIQLWRAPTNSGLRLWRTYFLRYRERSTRKGAKTLIIGGPDSNDLLRRRIVAIYSGTTNAVLSGAADDVMKDIVTSALSDVIAPIPTAGSRDFGGYLTVEADKSQGASLTDYAVAWRSLIGSTSSGVLTDIAETSRQRGSEIFFDVDTNRLGSSNQTIQYIFRTYLERIGPDVTDKFTFSERDNNLVNPRLIEDYTEEINYVYGGGQDQGADRDIQQVSDEGRYLRSIWGRCEAFRDARQQAQSDGVTDAARETLEDGRPRVSFSARIIDTAGARFQKDWDFGSLVRAEYEEFSFDAVVRAVIINLDDDGAESIDARIEATQDAY